MTASKHMLGAVLLLVVSAALYLPTTHHQFAWDDALVWTENEVTQKGWSGLQEIWTSRSYIQQRPLYRPVAQTYFATLHQFFPNNPKAGHWGNILLYGLFVVLLFVLLKQVFGQHYANYLLLFIALLFALHPTHAEVVANIKSADEILAALLGLLGLSFLLRYAKEKAWYFLGGGILAFTLGFLAKPSILPITPVIVVIPIVFVWEKQPSLKAIFNNLLNPKHWAFPSLLFLYILSIALLFLVKAFVAVYVLFALGVYFFYRRFNQLSFAQKVVLIVCFGAIGIYLKVAVLFLAICFVLLLIDIHQTKRTETFILLAIVFVINAVDETLQNEWYGVLFSLLVLVLFYFLIHRRVLKVLIVFLFVFIAISLPSFAVNAFLLVTLLALQAVYNESENQPKGKFFKVLFTHFQWIFLLLFVWLAIQEGMHSDRISEAYYRLQNRFQTQVDAAPPETSELAPQNQPYHNILVAIESPAERAATICRIQGLYLKKLVWPHPLVHQHGAWQIKPATWRDYDVYLSIVIHIVLLGLAVFAFKKKRYLVGFGIAWYFVSISIYTNIIRLMPDTLAERFLFVPSIGFCVAAVGGVYWLAHTFLATERHQKWVVTAFFLPVFMGFGYLTVDRAADWKDNYTLVSNTLPNAPENVALNAQFALELNNKRLDGNLENYTPQEAFLVSKKHYQKAIALYNDFFGAHYDLARLYIEEAKPDSALFHFEEARRINPSRALPHYYLGMLYYDKGKNQEGITAFEQALRLHSNKQVLTKEEQREAVLFLARLYARTNQLGKADTLLQNAFENTVPKDVQFMVLLGNIYVEAGQINRALDRYLLLEPVLKGDETYANTLRILAEQSGRVDSIEERIANW